MVLQQVSHHTTLGTVPSRKRLVSARPTVHLYVGEGTGFRTPTHLASVTISSTK